MGWTSPAFAQADVAQWASDREAITVEVEHIAFAPPEASRFEASAEDLAEDLGVDEEPIFGPGSILLRSEDIQLAAKSGSSHPPKAPIAAEVDYALVEQRTLNREDNPDGWPQASAGAKTGDGRLRLLIQHPPRPDPPDRASVDRGYGVNIYGIWEDAGTRALFKKDPATVTLAELAPWRMTQRYSWEEDLAGVFPGGAAAFPALKAILADPPWEPVAPLDGDIASDAKGDGATESENIPDTVIWSYDLRRGIRPRTATGPAAPATWDAMAPSCTAWRPDATREWKAALAGQRYRFWATCVDLFGQESELKPVQAADADASEPPTCDFVPRRRAPPGAARLADAKGAQTPGLAVTDTALTVSFLASWGETLTPVDDPDAYLRYFEGLARIYRRPLRTPVPAKANLRLLAAGDPLTQSPAWRHQHEQLLAAGWREFGPAAIIAPPAKATIPFRHSWPLTPLDRGHEYVAVVGARVADTAAALWASPAKARRLRKLTSGAPSPIVLVEETPNYGGIASTRPVPHANLEAPRALESVVSALMPARTVRPRPDIERDLVLMRLLSQPVMDANNNEITITDWGGVGITLTAAQAISLEAALTRVSGLEPIDPLRDPRLAATRRLLAAEIRGRKEALTRTASVGFRGLMSLRWRYRSIFSSQAPGHADEAEAVQIRLVSTKAPMATSLNRAQASVSVDTVKTTSTTSTRVTCLFKAPVGQALEQLRACKDSASLAALWPVADTSVRVWAEVVDLRVTGANCAVDLEIIDGAWTGGDATLALHLAALVDEQEIPATTGLVEGELMAPVGGGHAEMQAWWLVTASAQGRLCAKTDARRIHARLSPTIAPLAPVAFEARPPQGGTEWLDPAQADPFKRPLADWLPDGFTAEDARRSARVVVGWSAAAREDEVRLLVERERLAVFATPARAHALVDALSLDEILREVQNAPENGVLKSEWLAPLRTWLEARPALRGQIDDDAVLHGFDRPVDATLGLVDLGAGKVALVDYFRDPIGLGGARPPMSGAWIYRYRLTPYIDFGSGTADERYLLGRPTVWSGYVAPGAPALRIQVLSQRQGQAPLEPAVRFKIELGAQRGLFGVLANDLWRARVVLEVKRPPAWRLRSDPALGAPTRDVWVPVGDQVLVLSTSKTSGELADLSLSRGEAAEDLKLEYRVQVQQFMLDETLEREHVLESQADQNKVITVMVPGLAPSDRSEKTVIVDLSLD
jgi:hypothetical protein